MNKGEAIMKKKILVMAMTAAMLAAAGCGSGKSAEQFVRGVLKQL